jgi:hypothetical protein
VEYLAPPGASWWKQLIIAQDACKRYVLVSGNILLTVLSALIIFLTASYFLGFNKDDQLLMNQLKRKMGISYAG